MSLFELTEVTDDSWSSLTAAVAEVLRTGFLFIQCRSANMLYNTIMAAVYVVCWPSTAIYPMIKCMHISDD